MVGGGDGQPTTVIYLVGNVRCPHHTGTRIRWLVVAGNSLGGCNQHIPLVVAVAGGTSILGSGNQSV